mgnify:FL=1
MKANWWYMRDNHTFRKLEGNKKDIRIALMEEFLNGYTYGMLCTKTEGYEKIKVHANGSKRWEEFIDECFKVMV